eukprot:GGOE01005643.1.p7 GENE.GGOE01005643.1~~GGOE01005643.1.p7  ORF type:complete len:101 (-),score=6.47 GGOE01005643.1:946-1248(-)
MAVQNHIYVLSAWRVYAHICHAVVQALCRAMPVPRLPVWVGVRGPPALTTHTAHIHDTHHPHHLRGCSVVAPLHLLLCTHCDAVGLAHCTLCRQASPPPP